MTEPMFDHERLDVYQRSGEYEYEHEHEKRYDQTIPRFAIPKFPKPKESIAHRFGSTPTRTQ
jgi:hypothetical protein